MNRDIRPQLAEDIRGDQTDDSYIGLSSEQRKRISGITRFQLLEDIGESMLRTNYDVRQIERE